METSTLTWNHIPDEIQREIASHLDIKSLCFFAATSKRSLKNALPYLLRHQQMLLNPPYLSITASIGNSTFLGDASSGLYACGNNSFGQLGVRHIKNCKVFTPVTSFIGKILSVTAGDDHTFVLTDQGLWTCGYNKYGQLGLGHNTHCSTFTPVTSLKGEIRSVAIVGYHTLVLTDQGLWTCGYNGYGQLGLGHNNNCSSFTPVTSLKGKILSVTAGAAHTLVLTNQGLWACGYNSSSQLGLGHNNHCSSFALVQNLPTAVKARWSLYRHIQQLRVIGEPPSSDSVPSFAVSK